jgi:phosphate-selective porin OprO/OprP
MLASEYLVFMWRSTRARNRLGIGCLAAILVLYGAVSTGQEVAEQKTASQVYFETLGSLAPPADGDEGFPRTWTFPGGRTFQLRGRIDTDSIWTTQSAGDIFAYGELGDVVGLRRARIGAQGDLVDDRRYVLEIELASGVALPRDVFVGFGIPKQGGERRYGHFREPFSLEGNTSANYYMFLERSPINDLDPARSWGGCLFRANHTETATLAIGLFYHGGSDADFESGNGSTAAVTGRITAAPILENDGEELLHLGFVFSERVAEDGMIIINQHPRPGGLLDPSDSTISPFVPEIDIPADFQQLFNLQLATCNGPFWTQSEWYGSIIPQFSGPAVFLRGWYVSAGYVLTGEHRAYEKDTGVLGPLVVRRPVLRGSEARDKPHGFGAWELTARFSYLNFFDTDLPPGPMGENIGTRLPQATFGVNWYLADRMRLLVNYSYEAPDEVNVGTTEASVYAMRLNVFF